MLNQINLNSILQKCIMYKINVKEYIVYNFIYKNHSFLKNNNILIVYNNKIINDNITELLSYLKISNYFNLFSKFKNSYLFELYKNISSNIHNILLISN